jgi:hypothetical protein
MALSGVRVLHAIPGRIRLKLDQVRGNPELAWEVEEHLSRMPGVRSVEANPVTGSVLILFAERQATSEESIRSLATRWPTALGALDAGALMNGHANGDAHAPALASADRRIVAMFGSLNEGVSQVASGMDLKVLVPLGLFFLGIRGLFAERLPSPAWYDFFWFALSTFVMLNRPVIEGPAEPLPASLA